MNEIKMTNGKRATNEGIFLSLSLCVPFFLSLSLIFLKFVSFSLLRRLKKEQTSAKSSLLLALVPHVVFNGFVVDWVNEFLGIISTVNFKTSHRNVVIFQCKAHSVRFLLLVCV